MNDHPRVPFVIGGVVVLLLGLGAALVRRAESGVNRVALASAPKPVTVVLAQDTTFRESRVYVGTLRPWIEADVGPQFISAYVDAVLVRPGAVAKRHDVLATLDCRNASASSQAVAAEARAIDTRQKAVADESSRLRGLLDGGFVSPNEAEMKEAQSRAEEAQLASSRAKLSAMGLAVDDCVLRAPFDGEIATRTIDPGAFVRPGTAIVTLVDRSIVRMTFDVPESDFEVVAPGISVSLRALATGRTLSGTIARRSPSADPDTRTVHCEVDISDPARRMPVNTTAEARIEVGQPIPASAVPLDAAAISGDKAAIFVVDRGVARKETFKVLGERGGTLYLDTGLRSSTPVVTEGRSTLADGDGVAAKQAAFALVEGGVPREPAP
ncbi:MAG TPA: efflux RND transporter periplasmic adaptor subunit [Polyangiaceae bacterium]|nr:efflux RND transporter periplasmic adaptor subunit [Polyangiaceae bacterium]